MIVYLDASAVVKLIVDELGSDVMLAVQDSEPTAASSALCRVETRAALSRMRRTGRDVTAGHEQRVARFEEIWDAVAAIDVSDRVLDDAVRLTERHGLRGYDAVHLSSALTVSTAGADVAFACFDRELRAAAAAEGLELTPRELPARG